MFFYVKVNQKWFYCFELPKSYDVSLEEIDEKIDDLSDVFFECDGFNWTSASIECSNMGKFEVTYEYGERISLEEWINKNIY